MGVTVGETLEFYYVVFEVVSNQEKFYKAFSTEKQVIQDVSKTTSEHRVKAIYSADENGRTKEKSISLVSGKLQLVDVKHCEEGPDPADAYMPEPIVTPWNIQRKGENE